MKKSIIKKLINISLNGQGATDAVAIFQHHLQKFLLTKPEQFFKELELYTDIEIKSLVVF